MVALYIVGLACTAVLAVLNGSATGDSTYTVYLPVFTAFMVVGALVVARRPANAIGWLFSTIALLALGAHLAHEYFKYASVARPGAQPFAFGAVWYLAWVPSPCSA